MSDEKQVPTVSAEPSGEPELILCAVYRCRSCGEIQRSKPLGEVFTKHILPVFDQDNFLGGPNMRLHMLHNCPDTEHLGVLDVLRFEEAEAAEKETFTDA